MSFSTTNMILLGALAVVLIFVAGFSGGIVGTKINTTESSSFDEEVCDLLQEQEFESAVASVMAGIDMDKFKQGMENMRLLMSMDETELATMDGMMDSLTSNGNTFIPSEDFGGVMTMMEIIEGGESGRRSLRRIGGCGVFQYIGCLAAGGAAGLACVSVFACGVGVGGTVAACACLFQ